MASKRTQYSDDGKWKVEMKAWKTYLWVYSSIGSEVKVFRKETTQGIWGEKTRWVRRKASNLGITNTYYASTRKGSALLRKSASATDRDGISLYEWAIGFGVSITDYPEPSASPASGPVDMALKGVVSTIQVRVSDETLGGSVEAGDHPD